MGKSKDNILEVLKASADADKILRATASKNLDESTRNMKIIAQVVEGAWRSGILEPDLLQGIFDTIPVQGDTVAKFPLDFLSPDKESWFTAFVIPREGKIPERIIDADEVYVPTYVIGNAISWGLDYARDARWDVIARAIDVYTNGFVRRMNDDGWHVILRAAAFNPVVNDSAAAAGTFTLKLITDLQTNMKRLAGGRGSKVTDIYLSPESMADIRNFSNVTLDDVTLREILLNPADGVPTFFGVRFHEMLEFGAGQEYQLYLEQTLGIQMAALDTEFVVAIDQQNRDSFVMPIREDMSMFEDMTLHRQRKAGVYGWAEVGFAALDTRRAILGSL